MVKKTVGWWSRLFGSKPTENRPVATDDLAPVQSGEAAARAESALSGTEDLEPLLQLIPPPVDPDLLDIEDPDSTLDYGPDPVAEWSVTFRAEGLFDCSGIAKRLHEHHQLFERPTHHVQTVDGQITYLVSTDAPSQGVALIPAWSLASRTAPDPSKIFASALPMASFLAEQPERFTTPEMSRDTIAAQLDQAARITAIQPLNVLVVAAHPDCQFWNGREIWDLLHRVGLSWGDMDSFQWVDPTHQADYLIWVEADDGELGYALPERIAAGQQHFKALRFSFNIARSPAPLHVLDQLERIIATCEQHLDCKLHPFLDDQSVDGIDELRKGVSQTVDQLAAHGLKPGSDAVCRLI